MSLSLCALLLGLGIGLTAGHVDPNAPAPGPDPTVCMKRFEYEYKVLQKIMMCEWSQKKFKKQIHDQHDQLDFLTKKLKELYAMQGGHGGTGGGGGDTYIRWGKSSCPPNAKLVYEGYAGGSCYNHKGAAANPVCLPKNPEWANYNDGMDDHSAFMYGAEYQTGSRNFPGMTNAINDRDVPCAVCCAQKPKVLMIPAKKTCPTGWTLEYWGYLSAGHHNQQAASEYHCLDHHPQALPNSIVDNYSGYRFYFVEAKCGSLPCDQYKEHRELTCVVCSK